MANADWQPTYRDLRGNEPFLEDSLSENEMRQFVSGYLHKDRNGMYGKFWMTIRYLFGGYATA